MKNQVKQGATIPELIEAFGLDVIQRSVDGSQPETTAIGFPVLNEDNPCDDSQWVYFDKAELQAYLNR